MQLTQAQQQAVETDAREVLVVAGAGSGKTRVLTERVLFLLRDQGVSASEIMVLTFTRKAANELRERLVAGVTTAADHSDADRPLEGMMVGTFHSVALDILRNDGDRLGYDTKTLTVIEPEDADLLLKQVCRDLQYLVGKKWRNALSWKKVVQYREAVYRRGVGPGGSSPVPLIFNEYAARLYRLNVLDYGHILLQCRKLLLKHHDVRFRYDQRIKHVLVDELQDCDAVQHDLLAYFAPPATFFGVGDTRQSIYGFRGARPELMRERHPGATVFDLAECFRCGDDIIAVANSLIAAEAGEIPKPMIGATGGGGGTRVMVGRSAQIPEEIRRATVVGGYAYSDIAVLARNHRTLKRLADVFTEAGIPHHRVGSGFDVTATEGFRTLLAALRLSVNPRDNLAFLTLLPAFGIDAAEYAAIRKDAAAGSRSHWKEYRPALPTQIEQAIAAHRVTENRGAAANASEYAEFMAQLLWGSDTGTSQCVQFWTAHCTGMTVEEALRWFALRDSQDDLAVGNVVTLSTVHAAKGLEWPVVIVVGLNEGTFPSSQSLREDGGLEEERRVFYVGMARAKERLVVHYRRAEDQSQDRPISDPSRFLAEAGLME